ncbi:MAG: peptide chain release factor N(5)-glutamine methyltransferase [Solirubrobacterales bacterium]|nr:peptide chain release factor N(5)-glutamine methyltransferase [Solirubrobacterales bacterium]MBV9944801.1 peptide chain release factor N(5)-glutamine methyltransferase [Solirubrobacterales bacterium]
MPEAALAAAGPTVAGALRDATALLALARCDTPRLDAELLMAHALGVGRERLVLDARLPLDPSVLIRFDALVARRKAREPVAYIIARKPFRRITLNVDRRVLIPRPETELLVEVGLTLPFGASVVDVGTGSGAVALALADERPDLVVVGTDVDPGALAVARANGTRLGSRVEFLRADLLDGLDRRFDAVLANLPYVATGSELPPEVARYEPTTALFAGPDGLDIIRRLITAVDGISLVALEVGAGQAPAVAAMIAGSVEVVRDLAGHERVVVARH